MSRRAEVSRTIGLASRCILTSGFVPPTFGHKQLLVILDPKGGGELSPIARRAYNACPPGFGENLSVIEAES
jgi:hypothetical protein